MINEKTKQTQDKAEPKNDEPRNIRTKKNSETRSVEMAIYNAEVLCFEIIFTYRCFRFSFKILSPL